MSYANFKTLQVDIEQGAAFVTLAHGELNLLDMDMLIDLDRLGREIELDDQVKVVVLQSANPDFFVAHADLGLIQVLFKLIVVLFERVPRPGGPTAKDQCRDCRRS